MQSLFDIAEQNVSAAVQWLRLAIEVLGALVIALGVIIGIIAFVRAAARGHSDAYIDVRLTLARYLAVALEFQLGADILSTAIAPSWEAIGKLGAIAVIRTGLNYALSLEMEKETRNASRMKSELDAREGTAEPGLSST